tara:strand:- start:362 stop:595 length:234 start_codon:yes stop_codon:yes gene_type:complete
MKTNGIYEITEPFAYELEIHYEYYWEEVADDAPAEDEIEVTKVLLNGADILTFYYDFLDSEIGGQLYEYAQENKLNK